MSLLIALSSVLRYISLLRITPSFTMRLTNVILLTLLNEAVMSAPAMNERRLAVPEAYALAKPVGLYSFEKREPEAEADPNKIKDFFKHKVGGFFKKIGCGIASSIPVVGDLTAKKCQ
jgi:hypothetical protein